MRQAAVLKNHENVDDRKNGSMKKVARKAGFWVACVASFLAMGCSARRSYPEPSIGWHSPSYSVIFGRIQRVPGSNPDSPTLWTIRFADPRDAYQGELALTPPERLTGYSGGEHVEIHGHVMQEPTTDAYKGRWYVVDSIQMWTDYK
jgi:hypothetical protein